MLERYRRIFSALKEYIHEYSSDGYSQEKADILTALLQQNDSTPLDHIFQVFGCELFDKCTLTLALLISADHTVAMEISSYFGINKGYLTAGAVSGIFFGYTDIIPFYTSLLPDSPLNRLLDGVCAHSNAPLSVKDSIASFAFTGLIDDDNFLFSDEETEYLPLNSSVFAENEISSVLTKANLTKPFVMQIIGDNGSGRRTAIKRACESVKQPYIIIGLNHEISITSVKKLASKLLLMNTVPVIILNSSSQEIDLFLQRLANEVGFVFAVTNEEIHLSQVNTETLTVKLSKPTLEEQYCLWQAKSKQYPVSEDIDFAEIDALFAEYGFDLKQYVVL